MGLTSLPQLYRSPPDDPRGTGEATADVVLVPTDAVAALCDPFRAVCWHADLDRPVTREEIAAAIADGRLNPPDGQEGGMTREAHLGRIAWFAVHGWPDPISIDVGVPALGHCPRWPVEDGNHRLAAAIFRMDASISAEIGGQLSHARDLGLLPSEAASAPAMR